MNLQTSELKPTTVFLTPSYGLAPNKTTGSLDVVVRASPRPTPATPPLSSTFVVLVQA